MPLSRSELNRLKRDSCDPNSWGTDSQTSARSFRENSGLTDAELVSEIERRNRLGKPTYKLRLEYERRLRE
jgi:hypothetical protein